MSVRKRDVYWDRRHLAAVACMKTFAMLFFLILTEVNSASEELVFDKVMDTKWEVRDDEIGELLRFVVDGRFILAAIVFDNSVICFVSDVVGDKVYLGYGRCFSFPFDENSARRRDGTVLMKRDGSTFVFGRIEVSRDNVESLIGAIKKLVTERAEVEPQVAIDMLRQSAVLLAPVDGVQWSGLLPMPRSDGSGAPVRLTKNLGDVASIIDMFGDVLMLLENPKIDTQTELKKVLEKEKFAQLLRSIRD